MGCVISTVCPRSSDPYNTKTYCIEWVTTSWPHSTNSPSSYSIVQWCGSGYGYGSGRIRIHLGPWIQGYKMMVKTEFNQQRGGSTSPIWGWGGGSRPQFLNVKVYFLHATYIWAIFSESGIFFYPPPPQQLRCQKKKSIFLQNQSYLKGNGLWYFFCPPPHPVGCPKKKSIFLQNQLYLKGNGLWYFLSLPPSNPPPQ